MLILNLKPRNKPGWTMRANKTLLVKEIFGEMLEVMINEISKSLDIIT